MTLAVDEDFFDPSGKSGEELRVMWYVLGVANACYMPTGERGVKFTSKDEGLVKRVRSCLGSKHAIGHYPNRDVSSHWIEIKNTSLRESLDDLVAPKKEKRRFPDDVPEYAVGDFIRGFFDGKACVMRNKYGATYITLNYNRPFLRRLHSELVRLAGVEQKSPKKGFVMYNQEDAVKIYNFLYQDWDFLKKHRLYLPSKRDTFNLDYVAKQEKFERKMERARELLLVRGPDGKFKYRVLDVANELGYRYQANLSNYFRFHFGMFPSELRRIEERA